MDRSKFDTGSVDAIALSTALDAGQQVRAKEIVGLRKEKGYVAKQVYVAFTTQAPRSCESALGRDGGLVSDSRAYSVWAPSHHEGLFGVSAVWPSTTDWPVAKSYGAMLAGMNTHRRREVSMAEAGLNQLLDTSISSRVMHPSITRVTCPECGANMRLATIDSSPVGMVQTFECWCGFQYEHSAENAGA